MLQPECKVSALRSLQGQAVASRGDVEVYALKDRLQAAEEADATAEQRLHEASKDRDDLSKVWGSNSSLVFLLLRPLGKVCGVVEGIVA